MTYGGGQIFEATSTGTAGFKVAICSKLCRLTRNGAAGASCRGASVGQAPWSLQFATISARLRQAKFLNTPNKIQTPTPKSPEV